MKKHNRYERGQSFVELALMFVTLMLIFSALVDFGRLLYTYMSLVDSAQEGLLYLSLDPDDGQIGVVSRVHDSTTFPRDIGSSTVWIRDPFDSNPATNLLSATEISNLCSGDLVKVELSYPFQFTMPFINTIVPSNSIPLIASATGPILTPLC